MMANWFKTMIRPVSLCSMLFMMSVSSFAEIFTPKPFALELEGFFYRGIPVQVRGTQTLVQQPNGSWRMTLSARGPFVRLQERSEFIWAEDTLIPLNYEYELSAPFESETRSIHFDALANEIRATLNDQIFVHAYDPSWLDPLSYTLLLKRDLLTGQTPSEFTLFDRTQPRLYRFAPITHRYAPESSIVLSQIEPNRGDIFIVFSAESLLPAHLLRWRNGRIDYQIKTIRGQYDGFNWDQFPHWPTPRRYSP